jgi:hypothetical protein
MKGQEKTVSILLQAVEARRKWHRRPACKTCQEEEGTMLNLRSEVAHNYHIFRSSLTSPSLTHLSSQPFWIYSNLTVAKGDVGRKN